MLKIYLFLFTFYLSYLLHSKMFWPIKNTIWTTSVVYILQQIQFTLIPFGKTESFDLNLCLCQIKNCAETLYCYPHLHFAERITIVFMKFPGLASNMQDTHHFLSGKASSKLLFFVDKIIFKVVSCFQVFLLTFKT